MALAAGIAAGGSLLSGITGGKGAAQAAKIQAQAQANALAEQQREYNTNQANFAPYLVAGTSALGAQGNLVGLNGDAAQQSAITSLQGSPLYTSLNQAGTDALLQSAAATGGLRGGNTESALYNNRSQLLAQVIQQQLSNLGGISSQGVSAAGTAGGLGQSNANAQSGIYTTMGNTGASSALTGASIAGLTGNSLLQSLGTYLNSGQQASVNRNYLTNAANTASANAGYGITNSSPYSW